MEWSLGSWLPSHYISFKSVDNFLSNPANRQTNKQTDKQTNRQTDKRGWIHNIRPTTLANVIMCLGGSLFDILAMLWSLVPSLVPLRFHQWDPNDVYGQILHTPDNSWCAWCIKILAAMLSHLHLPSCQAWLEQSTLGHTCTSEDVLWWDYTGICKRRLTFQ